jgi:hypothetical protein
MKTDKSIIYCVQSQHLKFLTPSPMVYQLQEYLKVKDPTLEIPKILDNNKYRLVTRVIVEKFMEDENIAKHFKNLDIGIEDIKIEDTNEETGNYKALEYKMISYIVTCKPEVITLIYDSVNQMQYNKEDSDNFKKYLEQASVGVSKANNKITVGKFVNDIKECWTESQKNEIKNEEGKDLTFTYEILLFLNYMLAKKLDPTDETFEFKNFNTKFNDFVKAELDKLNFDLAEYTIPSVEDEKEQLLLEVTYD